MTLMGGPIDTRDEPDRAQRAGDAQLDDLVRQNVISTVPFNYPGAMRRVYPGFLQLTSFISMNLDRHVNAHMRQFEHLVKGDGDSADGHREILRRISRGHGPDRRILPADHRDRVQGTPAAARRLGEPRPQGRPAVIETALMTVEGELDDISGIGQTRPRTR